MAKWKIPSKRVRVAIEYSNSVLVKRKRWSVEFRSGVTLEEVEIERGAPIKGHK
jgi:hypothetical protein